MDSRHRSRISRPIRALARTLALLAVALGSGCGSPAPAKTPVSGAAACAAHDAAGCEKALLQASAAELTGMLRDYDATLAETAELASGQTGWTDLWTALKRTPEQLGVVHDGRHAALVAGSSPDTWVVPAGWQPRAVAAERLLLALGRHAGRRQLILVTGDTNAPVALQLFPHDLLAPHSLELAPIVKATAERAGLAAEIELGRVVRAALKAAGEFDYVKAAETSARLRQLIRARPRNSEPALRARFALSLLRAASIALEPAAADPATDERAAPAAAPGTALVEFMRVQLTDEAKHEQWVRRRARIIGGLSADRVALLDYLYRSPEQCAEIRVPPMERPADLIFASLLARALAPEAVGKPGGSAATGGLALDAWLERYEAFVRLVSSSNTVWAFATSLLAQRGELHGLSAEGTATHQQVSELGLKHVAALGKLAKRFPERFEPIGVLPLVYLTGVMSDRRLRDAVIELASNSVALKLARARDADGLYDAALAGVMAAMSYPPQIQGPQLIALRDAFAAKLDTPLGAEKGWTMAGLHAAAGVLGLLTGEPQRLREVAPRAAGALTGADSLEHPMLARLAVSATRYGALIGTDALDPSSSNPALFTPTRRAAREALSEAIAGLTPEGPTTGPERDLRTDATELYDGLIAVLGTIALAGDSSAQPQCPGASSLRDHPKVGNALQRLLRTRRRALQRTAFERGDSAWARRARLLVTVASDALDVVVREDSVKFTLSDPKVEAILKNGLADWDNRAWAEAVGGGYLLARAAVSGETSDQTRLGSNAALVLQALAQTFGADSSAEGGERSSLFDVLAKASQETNLAQGTDQIAQLLISYARQSYEQKAGSQGDLFLFVALGIALAREEPLPEAALTLAREQHRAVRLPLTLHAYRKIGTNHAADPKPLFGAMREAEREHCDAPSPESLIALRRALHDFRSGRRKPALAALDAWLTSSEQAGLVVPRMVYTYEETTEDTVFKVEGSVSLASDFLLNSGSLQVGLGMRTAGKAGGDMRVGFADPTTGPSVEEAARLYAHVAALTAVYHFLEGQPDQGSGAARRAVPAWAVGVRLGDELVPVGPKTAEWAQDAPGVLAVAGQQALEAGQIFLAGDLWTLARAALGAEANDEDVAAVLEPAPAPLRDFPKLQPVIERARRSLKQIAASLPCTGRAKGLDKRLRADCSSYPAALAQRVANALPALPRLKAGAEIARPRCACLRALDTFLNAADQKRYDPDAFTEAVAALRKGGQPHDAAALLARQRHPQHCSPALLAHARALGKMDSLGTHLRADLLSVAANCAGAKVDARLVDDLLVLDELTQRLPIPLRNLELMLFASRLALQGNRWEPLLRLCQKPNFVRRWLRFGPELATSALLVHHAAHVQSDLPVDGKDTLPLYRLLCTTFPPADRGPTCNAIRVLRGGAAAAEKKRAARDALTTLMGRMTVPRQGGTSQSGGP